MTKSAAQVHTRDLTEFRAGVPGDNGAGHGGLLNAKRLDASSTPPKPGEHFDSSGRFIHYCDHPECRNWGAFGFFTGPGRGGVRWWYCRDHIGEIETQRDANPKRLELMPERPVKGPVQGRLL